MKGGETEYSIRIRVEKNIINFFIKEGIK